MESVNEMSHKVADTTKEAGSSLVDLVRQHPLPAALIGAGIALLAAGSGVGVRERHRDEGEDGYTSYGSRYGYGEGDYTGYVRPGDGRETSSGYPNTDYAPRRYGGKRDFESYGAYDSGYDIGNAEAVSSGAARASWSPEPSEALHDWNQRESSTATRSGPSVGAAGRGLASFVEDQPLIAGLITLALGAFLGLLFPSTKREDELMGSARDHLAEQAREAAERAREAAQKTFEEARETAKEEFSRLSAEAKEDGKDLLEKGKEAAKHVGESAKESAKKEAGKSN